ncbi:hypothetical protein AIOL_004298 [Candidatus Rhodobacter oscarellae]|uniref:DUF4440 domain-containing protein n=1 Tax=Candidatus Rhodobacter oscarellae TaxID=1675527 RepID=A0A0J9E9L1_9RHOB|nr:hypothetical protein AIOL_004298 [Candidatus Rhodobacter lobularis]
MPDEARLTELLALERQVWDALLRGDAAADAALLNERFLGVYPSGFSDKAGHVSQLGDGPSILRYALSEARLLDLGEDRALLSYLAHYERIGTGAAERMYVSSIWERSGGGWRNIFSQDSPAA